MDARWQPVENTCRAALRGAEGRWPEGPRPLHSEGSCNGAAPVKLRQRRLGKHMHATVTAVWSYINADHQALAGERLRLADLIAPSLSHK